MPCLNPCVRGRLGAALLCLALAGPAAAEERVELPDIQIRGVQELPKVIYIVPWKTLRPDTSPLPARRLVDEALAPLDMDEFRRRVRYYWSMRGEVKTPGSDAPGGPP